MGSALVDGFERGFNMMQRYNAQKDQKNRLARLDEQNEQRYQDQKTWRESQKKESDRRYNESLAFREKQAKANADYRLAQMEATKQYQKDRLAKQDEALKWRKNQAEEQKQWSLLAPQLPNIHQQFIETGVLSDSAKQFFEKHPEYNDYNPEKYLSPEYRQASKALKQKTEDIFNSGQLYQFKDPEYIKLFNGAFQSKIKQGIGEKDLIRNATIIDKQVAQLIPTRDGKVSIGLQVTYKTPDGKTYSEIQPMTKGRTSENEDPVQEFTLQELMSGIEARARMADLAENKDYYAKRSAQALSVLAPKQNNKAQWKEVKGDLGQTLGWKDLNSGKFIPIGPEVGRAGLNPEDPPPYDEDKDLQQMLNVANKLALSIDGDLTKDDIETAAQMAYTAAKEARARGEKADVNATLQKLLQESAKARKQYNEYHAGGQNSQYVHDALSNIK